MSCQDSRSCVGILRESDGQLNASHDAVAAFSTEPAISAAHQIVLRGLEIANIAEARVCSVEETIAVLEAAGCAALHVEYPLRGISTSVAKILSQLFSRKVIFSPGKIGKHRYYGSARILRPELRSLPLHQSRRQRVLELIRHSVAQLNRCVQTADLIAIAERTALFSDIGRVFIVRDVQSLLRTGAVVVVESIRGGGCDGWQTICPADIDPANLHGIRPKSWLETVVAAFGSAWADEAQLAEAEGRPPRGLTTETLTDRLRQTCDHPNASDTQLVANAMIALASSSQPVIRRAAGHRGVQTLLWAPAAVSDEALDAGNTFATDEARAAEAVRRACVAAGTCAVGRAAVEAVAAKDPLLAPTGSRTLAAVLSDASKQWLYSGEAIRLQRVHPVIHRAGRIGAEAFYTAIDHTCIATDAERQALRANAFVMALQCELSWTKIRAVERLMSISHAVIPSVALGRAIIIEAECSELGTAIEHIATEDVSDGHTGGRKRELLALVRDAHESAATVITQARSGIDVSTTYPSGPPVHSVPTWTAAELLGVLQGVYPRADSVVNPTELVGLMFPYVRKMPNPDFTSRRTGPESLFDSASALMYAAQQWGGHHAILLAGIAVQELDHLRDPKYVIPGLLHRNSEVRLVAVACLAFLWSAESKEALKRTLVDEAEAGVRESALWAYGFQHHSCKNADFNELVAMDPSTDVRDLAIRMCKLDVAQRWRI